MENLNFERVSGLVLRKILDTIAKFRLKTKFQTLTGMGFSLRRCKVIILQDFFFVNEVEVIYVVKYISLNLTIFG